MNNLKLRVIATFLAVVASLLLPITALAQGFSVSPPSVKISGLPPGGETQEFPITITNKEDTAYTFQLTVYNPPDKDLREGYSQLPDNSWISFQPDTIEVPPNSSAEVIVQVTVPEGEQWENQNYEVWLGASPGAVGLFAIKLYVRLYILTTSSVAPGTNWGLIIGSIIVGVIAIICGDYYVRKKIRQK
jgi:hypothetical protein